MTTTVRVIFALALLLSSPGWATATTATASTAVPAEGGPRIVDAGFSDDSVAAVRGNTTIVWRGGSHNITANLTNSGAWHNVELCAAARPIDGPSSNNSTGTSGNGDSSDSTHELGCTPAVKNGTANVTFGDWPGSVDGPHNVTLSLRSTFTDDEVYDNRTIRVTVLSRDGDPDDDSLSNQAEIEAGTDPYSSDTDTDGVTDGAEVKTYGTDPLSNDTDQDGLLDSAEVSGGTNATNPDSDGDGLLDGAEVHEYGTDPLARNSDGDGLPDGAEVLRYHTDPLDSDTDGDGLSDSAEVFRYHTNPNKRDTDGDFLNDGLEVRLGTWPKSALDVLGGAVVLVAGLVVVARWAVTRYLNELAQSMPESSQPADGGQTALESGEAGTDAPDQEVPPMGPRRPASADGNGNENGQNVEVVSDEDRVVALLREHGGKIPQKRVAEETGWSASKVSRLLSSMSEAGTVTKITIGRENVIVLDDEE